MSNELVQFFIKHWELCLAFIALLGLLTVVELQGLMKGAKRVSPQQLTNMINRHDSIVLDIREDEAYQKGHIIGAMHIPLAKLAGNVEQLTKHKEQSVILVCQTGQKTAAASLVLQKEGFKQLYCLGGGMNAWQDASLPIVKEKPSNNTKSSKSKLVSNHKDPDQ